MIKLGTHITNWRHFDVPFEYVAKFAKEQGLHYLEFGVMLGQCSCPRLKICPLVSLESDPLEIRQILEDNGLFASQIDSAYPLNLPEATTYGITYIQKAVRFAHVVGAPRITVTDGHQSQAFLTAEQILSLMEHNLKLVLDVAERYDVGVNLETHGVFTTKVETLLRLVDIGTQKRTGITFDTGNVFISGNDPLSFLKAVAERVTHVHCKDVNPQLAAAMRGEMTGISGSAAYVGGGVNAENIKGCIQYLKERNWDGVLSIEAEGEERVKKSLDWLRPLI